jgi:4-amino-4-deoxy-L-arabinose transferase-like glycosyltransferase
MALPGGRQVRVGVARWVPWLLLAIGWFATIQVRPMLDPDEGRYAEIPREMLARGDWITPRFNDLKYFEKPPLQYWATAAMYALFGLSEWTSRAWSVGLAFACLPLVFVWVRRCYGEDAALSALTALAVSPFFIIIGHLNLLDAGFTFWLTAAVLAFTLAQSGPEGSAAERRWMLAAWALGALAVLSKGIVVGVLAGGALVLYTLIERDARPWRRLQPVAGSALFALIAVPWFVLVSLRNRSFPGFFFVHEHFTRFLTTVHQRVEPWWYFLPAMACAAVASGAGGVVLPPARYARGRRRWWQSVPAAALSSPLRGAHPGVLLRLGIEARALHPADGASAGRHHRRVPGRPRSPGAPRGPRGGAARSAPRGGAPYL